VREARQSSAIRGLGEGEGGNRRLEREEESEEHRAHRSERVSAGAPKRGNGRYGGGEGKARRWRGGGGEWGGRRACLPSRVTSRRGSADFLCMSCRVWRNGNNGAFLLTPGEEKMNSDN
jgi:hypothetical protein